VKAFSDNPESYLKLREDSSCKIKNARAQTGLKQAIQAFLEENFNKIEGHDGPLFLFGSGGHSIKLTKVMSNLGMRSIDGVVDKLETPDSRYFQGIKIVSPKDLADTKNPLVILSSKSYEPLFASIMQKEAPNIPFLRIWGDNDD
ncbi:MAG: hypothetical protein MI748_09810, partial [Opitutales bacterium]|nr:hypothetical protein [Opitutales bacterium]